MSTKIKLCKDCVHFATADRACTHPELVDVVMGWAQDCYALRQAPAEGDTSLHCGPDGRLWEARLATPPAQGSNLEG